MTEAELKSLILKSDLEDLVDNIILNATSRFFNAEQIEIVCRKLTETFGLPLKTEHFCIVGSAKIGFGLFQKRLNNETTLPAFRPFRSDSDVDIAITSPRLFEVIWDEISTYANGQPRMPWDSKKLGDYLVHGWLRPDHFPKNVRLPKCDDFWDTFRALSANRQLGSRQIRGALYHSMDHLRRYQVRGLHHCRQKLENEK